MYRQWKYFFIIMFLSYGVGGRFAFALEHLFTKDATRDGWSSNMYDNYLLSLFILKLMAFYL